MILQADARYIPLPESSIDAIVTDPPYELGFMGKKWDARGIAYDVGLWIELLCVLKPGGYLLAFGGTRTYHRMTCAIEDAGFEIRDSLHWIYGSGFPKSKASLKPAHEPIVLARKSARYSAPLNVDECRVGTQPRLNPPAGNKPGGAAYMMGITGMPQDVPPREAEGRWPPNILLDEDAAVAMDKQTGILTSGTGAVKKSTGQGWQSSSMRGTESRPVGTPNIEYGDSGGASRFFPVFKYQAKAPPRERPDIDGIRHPTVKPLKLMEWLVRLVTPPNGTVLDPFAGSGTTGEACLNQGYRCILIEKDPDYIKLIKERMNNAKQRGSISS